MAFELLDLPKQPNPTRRKIPITTNADVFEFRP